jgi:hypothetical protein
MENRIVAHYFLYTLPQIKNSYDVTVYVRQCSLKKMAFNLNVLFGEKCVEFL